MSAYPVGSRVRLGQHSGTVERREGGSAVVRMDSGQQLKVAVELLLPALEEPRREPR